jgi:hypothetical protein
VQGQIEAGLESHVVRLLCEAIVCAGCTALAVVHQKESGTEIIGTVARRRKRLRQCTRSAS